MFEYLRLEVDPNFRYEAGNFWLGCNEPAAASNLGNFPDPKSSSRSREIVFPMSFYISTLRFSMTPFSKGQGNMMV